MLVALVSDSAYYSLTVGASGAIYGLLLAWAMYFPHRTIYFYFLFPIPARVFVAIVGAIAFLSSLGGPGGGIAHTAHLGGLVVGYIYLKTLACGRSTNCATAGCAGAWIAPAAASTSTRAASPTMTSGSASGRSISTEIRGQESGVRDQGSGVRDQGSGNRDQADGDPAPEAGSASSSSARLKPASPARMLPGTLAIAALYFVATRL